MTVYFYDTEIHDRSKRECDYVRFCKINSVECVKLMERGLNDNPDVIARVIEVIHIHSIA